MAIKVQLKKALRSNNSELWQTAIDVLICKFLDPSSNLLRFPSEELRPEQMTYFLDVFPKKFEALQEKDYYLFRYLVKLDAAWPVKLLVCLVKIAEKMPLGYSEEYEEIDSVICSQTCSWEEDGGEKTERILMELLQASQTNVCLLRTMERIVDSYQSLLISDNDEFADCWIKLLKIIPRKNQKMALRILEKIAERTDSKDEFETILTLLNEVIERGVDFKYQELICKTAVRIVKSKASKIGKETKDFIPALLTVFDFTGLGVKDVCSFLKLLMKKHPNEVKYIQGFLFDYLENGNFLCKSESSDLKRLVDFSIEICLSKFSNGTAYALASVLSVYNLGGIYERTEVNAIVEQIMKIPKRTGDYYAVTVALSSSGVEDKEFFAEVIDKYLQSALPKQHLDEIKKQGVRELYYLIGKECDEKVLFVDEYPKTAEDEALLEVLKKDLL